MNLPLGPRLRTLSRARDLTKEAVATHLGISPQSVSKWERGDGYPDITLLPALAHYFGTTTDDLLGTDEKALSILNILLDGYDDDYIRALRDRLAST